MFRKSSCLIAIFLCTGLFVAAELSQAQIVDQSKAALGEEYYSNGLNVYKQGKIKNAIDLLLRSEKHDYPPASLLLGQIYYAGKGVEQNYKRALFHFRKAALYSLARAQYSVGMMLENGQGTKKDVVEAYSYYRNAADNGKFDLAQHAMAGMLYYGRGTEKNVPQAFKWFQKAANQGNMSSMCNIGMMYENGDGVAQNLAEAKKCYEKAAEKQNAKGQYLLAMVYLDGKGVAKDEGAAVSWLEKAAQQGFQPAAQMLQQLGKD